MCDFDHLFFQNRRWLERAIWIIQNICLFFFSRISGITYLCKRWTFKKRKMSAALELSLRKIHCLLLMHVQTFSKYILLKVERVQIRWYGLLFDELFSTLYPFSHEWNITRLSLNYGYFHGKCSNVLYSLVSLLQGFFVKTYLYLLLIPFRCFMT